MAPTWFLEPSEECPKGFRAFADSFALRAGRGLCQPDTVVRWVQSRPVGGRFGPEVRSFSGLLRFLERRLKDVVALELDASSGAILRLIRPHRTFEQHCETLVWMVEDRVLSALQAMEQMSPMALDRFVQPRLSPRRRRQARVLVGGNSVFHGLAVGRLGREILVLGGQDQERDCAGALLTSPGPAEEWLRRRKIPSLIGTPPTCAEGLVTLEGDRLYAGALSVWHIQFLPPGMERLLEWADQVAIARVLAEVSTPAEAELGLDLGARGGFVRLKTLLAGKKPSRSALRHTLAPLVASFGNRRLVVRLLEPDRLYALQLEVLAELASGLKRPRVLALMSHPEPGVWRRQGLRLGQAVEALEELSYSRYLALDLDRVKLQPKTSLQLDRVVLGLVGEDPQLAVLADRLGARFVTCRPLQVPGLRLKLGQAWLERHLNPP